MTASQFARLLHARRIGKGKWQAKCPSHLDNKPSLAIAEGKKGVVIRCMSHGCETADILKALGLTFSDLFRDKCTPEVRMRISIDEQREGLEQQLGLSIWLGAIDGKPKYWAAAEKRIRRELYAIRCRIEPIKIIQEYREREFQRRLRRLGWERLWQEVC